MLADMLRTAWAAYRRHPLRLSAIALVLCVAQLSVSAGVSVVFPQGLAAPVLLLLVGVLELGQLTLARRALNGEVPRLLAVFEPLCSRPLDYVWLVLAIGAGIIFAFIGVFVSLVLFMFAPVYVADGLAARAALWASARRVLAAPGLAAGLCALLVCLKMLGVLCFGVGILVTAPLSALIVAAAARTWPAATPHAGAAGRSA